MTPTPPGRTDPTRPTVGGDPVTHDDQVRPVVRQRVAHRRRRQKRTTIFSAAFTVLALVLLVAMVWVGWRSALRITGGRDEIVTDPEAANYVAEVRPTAVRLIAVTGDGGELISMLLVVSDAGATAQRAVPLSPQITLWDFEDAGPQSAAAVFADGGIDVLRLRLGAEMGFGSTDALVVPGSALVQLASTIGPVTVPLSDDVFAGEPDAEQSDVTVQYPAGDLELEPDLVDDFLAFIGYREPDPNRALRSGALWNALLEGVTTAPAAASLGEGEDVEVFAEMIAELVEAEVTFPIVPTTPMPLDVVPPVSIYRIDTAAMPEWVAANVPFPIAAFPGQLPTVAVLDGTGQEGAISTVARTVVGAGAEIALTGNAESFDVSASRVEFNRPEAREAAERIADAVGVPVTAAEDDRSDVDVTVVVGKDLLQ